LSGTKEENILEEGVPKDEITLMEEEKAHSEGSDKGTPPKEHKEPTQIKSPPNKNKKLVEEVEDESNILWFSDPTTPTSSTEETLQTEKKEEKTEPHANASEAKPER